MFNNKKLFYIFEKIFSYFHLFKKIIIQTCKIIKNKTLNIKIFLKNIKNILSFKTDFYSIKIKE